MDEYNYTANAVALLGYYRLVRQELLTIQQVNIENVDTQNYNFILQLVASQMANVPQVTSTFDTYDINVEGGSSIEAYYGYSVGIDHALVLMGSFSIASLEFWFTRDGRR